MWLKIVGFQLLQDRSLHWLQLFWRFSSANFPFDACEQHRVDSSVVVEQAVVELDAEDPKNNEELLN